MVDSLQVTIIYHHNQMDNLLIYGLMMTVQEDNNGIFLTIHRYHIQPIYNYLILSSITLYMVLSLVKF